MPQSNGPELATPGAVGGRPWALDLVDGPRVAKYLALLPDGRIGGSVHRSETRWLLTDGQLRFFDAAGLPSATFRIDEGDPGASGALYGTSVIHGAVVLRPLQAQVHHAAPEGGQPARGASGRRNLVLLRAGADSLHPFWTRDIAEADRNWDLCLSWYGDPAARPDGCEHFFPAKGTKFEGLANILANETIPWDYDYVWMPDDDLMTGWADINLLFALAAEYDLMLAQPSLDKDCFINHPITRTQPQMLLRFCSFVEIMAPLFSRAALAICAPTFSASRTGYGLDHVWPRLIGAPPSKVAIIDAISVVHTRPIGATYDLAAAIAEGEAMEDAYGTFRRYQVLGYILAEPLGFVRLRDRTSGAPIFLAGDAARQVCA